MMQIIQDWELNQLANDLKQKRDYEGLSRLMDIMQRQEATNHTQPPLPFTPPLMEPPKLSWEQDECRNKKSVTINVQVMIENLLGGQDPNRDVQVRLEKYGHMMHENSMDDHLAFVVVNICDIKTGSIITLRETYAKFPSPEFLTKLELLRVGKTDGTN